MQLSAMEGEMQRKERGSQLERSTSNVQCATTMVLIGKKRDFLWLDYLGQAATGRDELGRGEDGRTLTSECLQRIRMVEPKEPI